MKINMVFELMMTSYNGFQAFGRFFPQTLLAFWLLICVGYDMAISRRDSYDSVTARRFRMGIPIVPFPHDAIA